MRTSPCLKTLRIAISPFLFIYPSQAQDPRRFIHGHVIAWLGEKPRCEALL